MKRFTTLLLVAGLIAFIYGCCSHSGDAIFVNQKSDSVVTSREVIIDELGRLPTVTFPSGTTIVGAEENTLKPGIVVTVIEEALKSASIAVFNQTTSDIYIYIGFQGCTSRQISMNPRLT